MAQEESAKAEAEKEKIKPEKEEREISKPVSAKFDAAKLSKLFGQMGTEKTDNQNENDSPDY